MIDAPQKSSGRPQSAPNKLQTIWNRVGYVEIILFQGNGSKTFNFEGLDFKFNVSQILGRVPEGNMSVSICGVSQDTANQIVTLCNVMQALVERKTLKLYAGYADPENKDYKGELIATMDIINATITTPPPDIWLQITGVYAAWLNDRTVAIDIMNLTTTSIEGGNIQTPVIGGPGMAAEQRYNPAVAKRWAGYVHLATAVYEICNGLNKLSQKAGRKTRYTYDISRVTRKGGQNYIPGKTRRFLFSGTLEKIPTKISEYYKVLAIWEYRDNDTICLMVYPDPRQLKFRLWNKVVYKTGEKIKFLDVEHGLIGIPKLKDSIKLECRCFLDGTIQVGDYVSVRSELLPVIYEMGQNISINNKNLSSKWGGSSWRNKEDWGTVKAYQIMKIKYTGHLRGNEWYCDIEARRPDIIQNHIEEVKVGPILITEDFSKIAEGWEWNNETGELTKKL